MEGGISPYTSGRHHMQADLASSNEQLVMGMPLPFQRLKSIGRNWPSGTSATSILSQIEN